MSETTEIQMAVLKNDVHYTKEKVNSIEVKIDDFHKRFDAFVVGMQSEYVRKDDYVVWRNILIVGLLSTVATGIIMSIIRG